MSNRPGENGARVLPAAGSAALRPSAWIAGLFICGFAVALRVWLAWVAPEGYDMKWHWPEILHQTEQGVPLYEQFPYHFPPMWSWVLQLIQRVSRLGLPFGGTLRTFLTLVDVASACLLFRIARQLGRPRWAWTAPILLLTNPVSIWASAVLGQFDNIALFFLLAAILATLPSQQEGAPVPARAGVFLFLSMVAKQITAFHPLLWLRRPGGVRAVCIAYAATALSFVPYLGHWRAMLQKMLVYGSIPISYGFSEFVVYDRRFGPAVAGLSALTGLVAAWALGKSPLPRACLLLFLVLLIFAPGLGAQYLTWPLGIGALFAGSRYFLFSGASLLWILGPYFGVIGSGRWMGHLVWLSAIFWALGELPKLRQPPPAPAISPDASSFPPETR